MSTQPNSKMRYRPSVGFLVCASAVILVGGNLIYINVRPARARNAYIDPRYLAVPTSSGSNSTGSNSVLILNPSR